MKSIVTANGKPVEAQLPCSIEDFLVAQKLLPRSQSRAGVSPAHFPLKRFSADGAAIGSAGETPALLFSRAAVEKLFRGEINSKQT
jgi:hypothetical protein